MNWLVWGKQQFRVGTSKSSGECRKPQTPTLLDQKTVVDVATSSGNTIWVLDTGRIIDPYRNLSFDEAFFIQAEAGDNHFIALSNDGRVFTWGSQTANSMGHTASSLSKPTELTFFKDKKISKVYAGNYYCLCLSEETGILYGFGHNGNGDLGNGNSSNVATPIKLHENVEKVWLGFCWNTFLQYKDGKVKGFGYGGSGSLGTSQTNVKTPLEMKFPFDSSKLKKIQTGYTFSAALTTDNKVYGCGENSKVGTISTYNTWKEIEYFKDIPIVDIVCGQYYTMFIGEDGSIYEVGNCSGWGTGSKIKKLDFKIEEPYERIYPGYNYNIFVKLVSKTFNLDLEKILESGEFSDLEICGTPVHKFWIETRLQKKMDQRIENFFLQFDKEQFKSIVDWIYTEKVSQKEPLKSFFKEFNIDPKERSIENDLLILYKDEDSKDFTILVPVEEDDEDEYEEDDEEQEEELDEFPIHKFILQVSCGIYREMFKNVQTESNQVKDFSKKSPDAFEVFIKYLYTGEVELNADCVPELIVEDLSDAIDYFQLNPKSNIKSKLEGVKKQFGLN
ncbi:btk-binding protein-related [Anaeramoeba flamelloides]|uniref:Btk-binding protein-related n=1 Tax=Anaeramoeba flamelloides TaxID=1746091 RepID=A0ABQ8YAJ4_9EUKA|nr:btk-binding protein-related [Anaeramoeba flamelloides]